MAFNGVCDKAMRANIELDKLIGVSSNTMVAIPIDEFDQDLSCFL